jgi:hypothetical protein
MHSGENLEMQIDKEVEEVWIGSIPPFFRITYGPSHDTTFTNPTTAQSGGWCTLLNDMRVYDPTTKNIVGMETDFVQYATISGERDPFCIPIGNDDGIVDVDWVRLSAARFNPTIFASHSHMDPVWGIRRASIGELSLTECLYTAEFIRLWLIDDDETCNGALSLGLSGLNNPWEDFESRVDPGIDDYEKAVATQVELWTVAGDWVDCKAFPIHRYDYSMPVFDADPSSYCAGDPHLVKMWTYDMDGLVRYDDENAIDPWVVLCGSAAGPLISSPAGGEDFASGEIRTISWDRGFNDALCQKLYYSLDAGNTWTLIDSVGKWVSTYSWRIPSVSVPSTSCRIRIYVALDSFTSTGDLSNGYFTIRPYRMRVTSPSEGNVWQVGSSHTITWEGYYAASYQKLHYSTDNGGTWTKIDSIDGFWRDLPWTVPATPSPFCLVRVDAHGPGFDYSSRSGVFTIVGPNPPLAPSSLHCSWDGYAGRKTLTWRDNSTNEQGFRIWHFPNYGPGYQPIGTVGAGVTTYSYTTSSCQGGNIISAYNTDGEAFSSPISTCCAPGGGCPFVYSWNGQEYVEDNNILASSGDTSDVTDYHVMEQTSVLKDGVYSLLISEFETEHSYFDRVQLYAVDHASDVTVGVKPDGTLKAYRSIGLPTSCIDDSSRSMLSWIISRNDTVFNGDEGDTLWLDVENPAPEKPVLPMTIMSGRKSQSGYGQQSIVARVWTGQIWKLVGAIHPRENLSRQLIDVAISGAPDTCRLKLVWTEPHPVDFVCLALPEDSLYTVEKCSLASAYHWDQGDVAQQLSAVDRWYAELIPGETIELSFSVPSVQQGETRDFVLVTRGHYVTLNP